MEEDEGASGVELGGRGVEEEGPCAGDSGGVVFGGVLLETGGETAGDVDGEGVVHEEEGLRGDGGERAGGAVRVHDGEVEGIEDGEGSGAAGLDVETAAVGAGGDRVDFVDHAVARVDDFAAWDDAAGGDIAGDGDGFAADGGVETAGDGEHGVAEGFGVEALEFPAAVEIFTICGGMGVVGLLPCAACQDEFVETFELPVMGGEVGGEPVEEVRVGGG